MGMHAIPHLGTCRLSALPSGAKGKGRGWMGVMCPELR